MTVESRVRPKRDVVIDDTDDLRDLLSLALRRHGFLVVAEASDGATGIEVVRNEQPDVILLDLSMPVMDGLAALPVLRRHCPDATIVVFSGFGATQMAERALAIGADGYVQKGAPLDQLLIYIRDLADGVASTPPRLLNLGMPADTTAPAANEAGVKVSPQALELSPTGVIEVADDVLLRVIYANPAAERVLGEALPEGAPLAAVCSQLAAVVTENRLSREATLDAEVRGRPARVAVRRLDRSLLIYLDSVASEEATLRRAIATTAQSLCGPVALICGIAEASDWGTRDLDEDQRRRMVAALGRQARLLDAITADLLTAADITAGTLSVSPAAVSPVDVVRRVISERHGVEIDVEVSDHRDLFVDPVRLEQIVTNLIANAAKHGRPPVSVRVRADVTDPLCKVAIDVIDQGPGVPLEAWDSIFNEFAHAGSPIRSGVGLGLYVVRSLAEAMGGTATFRPNPDGGSIFTASLPAC